MSLNILKKIKKGSLNNLCGNNSYQFRLDLNYDEITNYFDKISFNEVSISNIIIKKLSTHKFFKKYKILLDEDNKKQEKDITIFDDSRILITNCNNKEKLLNLIEKIFQDFS